MGPKQLPEHRSEIVISSRTHPNVVEVKIVIHSLPITK